MHLGGSECEPGERWSQTGLCQKCNKGLSLYRAYPIAQKYVYCRHIQCDNNVFLQMTSVVTSQKPNQAAMKAGDFHWPTMRNERFADCLTNMMFSFKNIYSENINSSNLMFVLGPTKTAKSWLVRDCMSQFAQAKTARPCIFHFDLSDSVNENLSFDMFLVEFERMLIE